MKTLSGIIACGIIGLSLSADAQCCRKSCSVSEPVKPSGKLTDAESRDLLLMREEEKLARDVYNALHETYNQRVFVNIPRAEQVHMDAVLRLLESHGLADPAKRKPGKFRNKELQDLYNQLVKRGKTSREEAFLVGALVEEVDIADLIESMQRTEKQEILAVYENLVAGSKRHLNAFVRNYEATSGKTYQAQKMAQADVDKILGR